MNLALTPDMHAIYLKSNVIFVTSLQCDIARHAIRKLDSVSRVKSEVVVEVRVIATGNVEAYAVAASTGQEAQVEVSPIRKVVGAGDGVAEGVVSEVAVGRRVSEVGDIHIQELSNLSHHTASGSLVGACCGEESGRRRLLVTKPTVTNLLHGILFSGIS